MSPFDPGKPIIPFSPGFPLDPGSPYCEIKTLLRFISKANNLHLVRTDLSRLLLQEYHWDLAVQVNQQVLVVQEVHLCQADPVCLIRPVRMYCR